MAQLPRAFLSELRLAQIAPHTVRRAGQLRERPRDASCRDEQSDDHDNNQQRQIQEKEKTNTILVREVERQKERVHRLATDPAEQELEIRKRLKLAPWIELIIGCYFLLAILYTFTNHNYFTAPFLILFVIGYWYTGLMSLLQGRFDRWRGGTEANTDESSPKPFPVGV